MQISLRSIEPISMPHIPREEAMAFLRHFGNETFEFPVHPRCALLHTLKYAYPRHSFAEGWLFSFTGDQLYVYLNQSASAEALQEHIIGTLYFEMGGTVKIPRVQASAF
jgi:hypothetical protein